MATVDLVRRHAYRQIELYGPRLVLDLLQTSFMPEIAPPCSDARVVVAQSPQDAAVRSQRLRSDRCGVPAA